jgi:hypothetical protein
MAKRDARAAADETWTTALRPNRGDAAGKRPNRNPITLIRYADITARLTGRPLVRGILEREQISEIFGEAGCGKTFLALDLGLHTAAGLDWFGRPVAQGPVVYVAAEAGTGIINRVAAWRHVSGIVELPFVVVTSSVDLCHATSGDLDRLIAAIRAADLGADPVLLEIDTVSRVLAGGNENAPDDMGALVCSLDRLRAELHCHVLAVHHTGKETARGSRGHSLLRCAVDTEIEVLRDSASGISTVTVTKQRDGPTEGAIAFTLRRVELGKDDDKATPRRTAKPRLSAASKIALDTLRRATAEAGKNAPTSNHIPPSARGVDVETWRGYYYAGTASDKQTPEARKKAFQRVREQLQAAGVIGLHADFCWVVADV